MLSHTLESLPQPARRDPADAREAPPSVARSNWHLVTGEFPPAPGGVSDYTAAVALELSAAGDAVDVWCPAPGASPGPGVTVHPIAGGWSAGDLRRLDAELDRCPEPRRLLVQWVPHAYGRRSLNVAFCRWVRRRGRRGDRVELMVHEPFLAFREGSLKQDAGAAVHRVMAMLLLSVARRVWVSIPAWAARLRPWALGRDIPFRWMPVPSNVPVVRDPAAVAALRARFAPAGQTIVGHFGTYGEAMRRDLGRIIPALLEAHDDVVMVLLGRGAKAFATGLDAGHAARVHAVGGLPAAELSLHLQACDLFVQPYVDGVSTRRGTAMAVLSHGRALVTTLGHLSESFWPDSGAAVLTTGGDADACVAAAVALARDPARRDALGQTARALYDAQFDLRHTVRALREPGLPGSPDPIDAHRGRR